MFLNQTSSPWSCNRILPNSALPKSGQFFVLTISHQRIPHFVLASILNQLHAIQPMLYMVAFHNDHGCVELFLVERLLGRSRNQVVKRTELAVTLHTQLGIGMLVIVQNLELATDGQSLLPCSCRGLRNTSHHCWHLR